MGVFDRIFAGLSAQGRYNETASAALIRDDPDGDKGYDGDARYAISHFDVWYRTLFPPRQLLQIQIHLPPAQPCRALDLASQRLAPHQNPLQQMRPHLLFSNLHRNNPNMVDQLGLNPK